MKCVLVTFHRISDTSVKEVWVVHRHERLGVSTCSGFFNTEFKAMSKAHDYALPVMRGKPTGYNITKLLKVLEYIRNIK